MAIASIAADFPTGTEEEKDFDFVFLFFFVVAEVAYSQSVVVCWFVQREVEHTHLQTISSRAWF